MSENRRPIAPVIGPEDYVGNPLSVMDPSAWGLRPEAQSIMAPRGHGKVPVDPSQGTKVNPENTMPSQAERLGARRAVEKNTHATHRTTHPDKERNVVVVPSSGATHRDTFNMGPGIGYA